MLLVLAGLLPWQLFAAALNGSSGSLVSNSSLIYKIYFPRRIVPLSALAVSLIDSSIVFVLFTGLAAWFGYYPTWHWWLLPFFVLLAMGAAFGIGLWLTSLTVKFRDFRFIVPFLRQIGVFVTPVGFRTDFFPNWRGLLALNPMTAAVDGFRWCLLGGNQTIDPIGLGFGCVLITVIIVNGLWYFRRTEKSLADVI
ncbi:MAG: ABC transporter permease [Candidatus Synoicihabitans palmerolidicus]|nr:ABC transporter permease [Candidatus Synoicihabitans palmerolidicus]